MNGIGARVRAELGAHSAVAPYHPQFARDILCACNTWTCLSRLPTRYVNGAIPSLNS